MKQGAARSDYLDWLAEAFEVGRRFTPLPDGDVVVGYATGYDAADIAAFVLSLRAVFDGPVALVVDAEPDLRAFLTQNGVTAVDAPTWRGWAPHPVMQRFVAFAGLPYKDANYWSEQGETTRQAVNAWIRTGGEADGVIDFDAVMRDPAEPLKLAAAYDSGDHLHPNDAGFRAMADAIDLTPYR